MPILKQARIYRADLRANRGVLYVFGDNEARVGFGGQAAEMRGEPNAIGVATLMARGRYWNDARADHQCAIIDADLARAFEALRAGEILVWPLDGIGTGFADLERQSPRTWAHLQRRIAELFVTEELF